MAVVTCDRADQAVFSIREGEEHKVPLTEQWIVDRGETADGHRWVRRVRMKVTVRGAVESGNHGAGGDAEDLCRELWRLQVIR